MVPTILEVAQADTNAASAVEEGADPPALPGESLVPVFRRDGSVSRDYLWWCHEGNRAIRIGEWKLVAAGDDGPWELYDLSSDRTETKDLADRFPERVRELKQAWTQHFEESRELAVRDI